MKKVWHVYIVRCRDGTLYAGIALDVAKRIREHSLNKGSRYLRGRAPLKVVYRETHPNKSSALKREHALKCLSRAQKLALIASKKI